ncbi:transglutaminase-like domain-containing protein [Butyrivibrio proteoclasticus]|uniref:transglutaminase-like domain-containing protein n=1 Tax=Butyrivibrio proteoclasticus TaxID=43305 RepID=UPI0004790E4F|nr:transglutaminase-like domain-containing protein [Butyrivibrio proteoclasticus]
MKKPIFIALLTTVMLATTPITTYAKEQDTTSQTAQELYNQLVVNKQDTAVAYAEPSDSTNKILKELSRIDDESNPYDGDMTLFKAPAYKTVRYKSGKIEVTLINNINIEESEELLDKMELEIRANLPESPTQKQCIKAITKYINKTYDYDFAESASNESTDLDSFISAYYGDKKMVCTSYAVLTKLLCNRFGIDCRLIEGKDHVFNAIRLEGEKTYTMYDLTNSELIVNSPRIGFISSAERNHKICDDILEYDFTCHYSITYTDLIEITMLTATVVLMLAIIKNKKNRKKSVKRRKRNK